MKGAPVRISWIMDIIFIIMGAVLFTIFTIYLFTIFTIYIFSIHSFAYMIIVADAADIVCGAKPFI